MVSFSTSEYNDIEEARNHVAAKAIKYMEDTHGVVPGDYNHTKVIALERTIATLHEQLRSKDRSVASVQMQNTTLKNQLEASVQTTKLLSKGVGQFLKRCPVLGNRP